MASLTSDTDRTDNFCLLLVGCLIKMIDLPQQVHHYAFIYKNNKYYNRSRKIIVNYIQYKSYSNTDKNVKITGFNF